MADTRLVGSPDCVRRDADARDTCAKDGSETARTDTWAQGSADSDVHVVFGDLVGRYKDQGLWLDGKNLIDVANPDVLAWRDDDVGCDVEGGTSEPASSGEDSLVVDGTAGV